MGTLLNPYRYGTGGGGVTDPHFASVILLQNFENAANLYENLAPPAFVMATTGSALAQSLNGKWSKGARGAGTIARQVSTTATDFDMVSGNFTIEGWFYRTSTQAAIAMLAKWSGSHAGNTTTSQYRLYCLANKLEFRVRTVGDAAPTILTDPGADFPLSTYFHACAERDGTNLRLYKDGVMVAKATGISADLRASTNQLQIGYTGFGSDDWLNANNDDKRYDDLRITKGVARYANDAGFTPPSAPFPTS